MKKVFTVMAVFGIAAIGIYEAAPFIKAQIDKWFPPVTPVTPTTPPGKTTITETSIDGNNQNVQGTTGHGTLTQ